MSEPVEIPKADAGRDAIHAIRGYAYQLYATAMAWARLPMGATLHVERGSDYMEVAATALAGVEVKSTEGSGAVTLRSPGVVILINRFWRLARANPGRPTSMMYLTTSPAGLEQGAPFGQGVAGLDYWRQAAGDVRLVPPLRALLLSLALDDELAAWLQEASDIEVRDGLLRPVRFACGEPHLGDLADLVGDAMVELGAGMGLLPSDCRQAVPAIVLHLLRLAAESGERAVTAVQLREMLELAGTSRVANAVLQQMQPSGGGSLARPPAGLDVRMIPSTDLVVERSEAVSELASRLAADRVAWLTGASGLGKTGLALQLASGRNDRWSLVELEGKTSAVVAERLRHAQALTLDPAFGGLILDDLPQGLDRAASTALRRLAAAARLADGAVIVTAYDPPPPTLSEQIAPGADIIWASPYFTEEEVGAFIIAEGGDAEVWARSTHMFCGGGHPQLVAARISGLKRRGWPEADLAEGLLPDAPITDLVEERAAIQARLVRELPDHAKRLLYRLSVPSLAFDRPVALAVAAVQPPIDLPGEALDLLLGPWVERRGEGRMRASPLVAETGANALASEELLAVHAAVSRELAGRRSLQASTLMQLFLSAFIVKDVEALARLATAVIMANWRIQAALADTLFGLQLLRLDRPPLPEHPEVSRLIRLAQLKLCARAEGAERALKVYRCFIGEVGDDPADEPFRLSAIAAVLMPADSPMSPEDWFPILRELETLPNRMPSPPAPEGIPPMSGDQAQVMFLWRTSHLRGVADLEALFALLDALPEQTRRYYLEAFKDPHVGPRSLVQPAWVKASHEPAFDAADVAARYLILQRSAEEWGADDFVIECFCTRIVLLAEYARDETGALAVLSEAEARFSSHPRLRRERTKIMIRAGQHAEAADMLESVLDNVDEDDVIERFHILRDIATSAAERGDFAVSALRFNEAIQVSLRAPTARGVSAGLYADLAAVQVRLGENRAAGESLLRAAELADGLNSDDLQDQFRLRTVAGTGAWVWSVMAGVPQPAPAFGVASGGVPDAPLPGAKASPLTLWHQVRLIERELGAEWGAAVRLDAWRAKGVSPFWEGVELREAISHAMTTGDLDGFMSWLGPYCRYAAYKKANGPSTAETASLITNQPSWAAYSLDLKESVQLFAGKVAVANFVMRAAIDGRWGQVSALAKRLADDPALTALAPVAEPSAGTLQNLMNSDTSLVPALAVIFGDERLPEPPRLLAAVLRAWEWMRLTPFLETVGPGLVSAIAAHWWRRFDEGPFALRNPAANRAEVLAAVDRLSDAPSLARLILAAQYAADFPLPADFVDLLRSDAAAGPSQADPDDALVRLIG